MQFVRTHFSSEDVIQQLQSLPVQSAEQHRTIQLAVAYLEALLPRGRMTKYGQVEFCAHESEPGICPACGYGELEAEDEPEETDNGQATRWWCPNCKSSGLEKQKLVFDGAVITELSDEGHRALLAGGESSEKGDVSHG